MRTKAQIGDLEDRDLTSGQQIITDGAGHFVLGAASGGHATGTVVVYDEDTFIGVFDTLNFVGAGVSVYNSGSYAAVAVTGSAGGGGGGGGSGSYPIGVVTGTYDASTRSFTTNVTWLYIGGSSGTFTVDRSTLVTVIFTFLWGGTNNSWEYIYWRALIDGIDLDYWSKRRSQNRQNDERFVHTSTWITYVASGTHTFSAENYTNSGFQWQVYKHQLTVLAHEGGTAWTPLLT